MFSFIQMKWIENLQTSMIATKILWKIVKMYGQF